MKFSLPWANKPKDNYLVLVGFILASQAAGAIGSIFTFSAIPTWYAYLNKPFFSPPNWVFGPVWTILYTLIGVSAYLIWRKFQFGKKSRAFWHVFLAQLVLNAFWSLLFFGAKMLGLAFLEILAMWYFIARSIQEGKKLSPWAGYLLYPYIAWVSFATLLNFSLMLLQ